MQQKDKTKINNFREEEKNTKSVVKNLERAVKKWPKRNFLLAILWQELDKIT